MYLFYLLFFLSMSIEVMEPGMEICDSIYGLTWDYLAVLAENPSDPKQIIDTHARLCDFLQGELFTRFRESVGDLIWVSSAESIYANWLEIGNLRDQVIWTQNPHRNKDGVTLLIWALRARMEIARGNDIPFLESRFAQ